MSFADSFLSQLNYDRSRITAQKVRCDRQMACSKHFPVFLNSEALSALFTVFLGFIVPCSCIFERLGGVALPCTNAEVLCFDSSLPCSRLQVVADSTHCQLCVNVLMYLRPVFRCLQSCGRSRRNRAACSKRARSRFPTSLGVAQSVTKLVSYFLNRVFNRSREEELEAAMVPTARQEFILFSHSRGLSTVREMIFQDLFVLSNFPAVLPGVTSRRTEITDLSYSGIVYVCLGLKASCCTRSSYLHCRSRSNTRQTGRNSSEERRRAKVSQGLFIVSSY